MGFRERLNEHRGVAGVVAGAVIVAALVFGLRGACAGGGGAVEARARQFFSVDDGKTWFAADASNVPPFQHEGRTAYRVKVYRCPDGTEFVSHLERYSPADKRRLEDMMKKSSGQQGAAMMAQVALGSALEVKDPGDEEWTRWSPQTAERFEQIMQPRCPDGSASDVQPVVPQ